MKFNYNPNLTELSANDSVSLEGNYSLWASARTIIAFNSITLAHSDKKCQVIDFFTIFTYTERKGLEVSYENNR